MSEEHSQSPWLGIEFLYSTYMWVWGALLILTVVEVIVPEPSLIGLAQFPRSVTVLALILLALAKTFMVAWYYMHLIDERPSIILVACAPFIFSIFLTIGLWPHLPPHSAQDKDPMDEPEVVAVGQPAEGPRHAEGAGDEDADDGMDRAHRVLTQRP